VASDYAPSPRNIANTVAIKVLFLDLDVKGSGYAATDEAMRALIAVCVAIGLPTPSIVVYSSALPDGSPPVDSSLHCYWVLNRTLSVEEWRPLARAFKTALQKRGLVFDLNVPSNVAGVLRPLGSVNRKYDPPRVARLAFAGPDCDLDAIRAALAHVQPEAEREYSRDRNSDADFDEIVDIVEHLATRGCFDRGHYEHGRDLTVNEARFEDALTRTADRLASDHDLVTPASLFRAAYAAGWRRADALRSDQRSVLARARRRLRLIFAEGHDRVASAKRANRLIDRIVDPSVRAALAPSFAHRLARDGWDEATVLDALECLTGRRDVGLARWARRRAES
jgi:hypothetical protein